MENSVAKNQSKPRLSIVIPVLNEGVNLKILLRILEAVVDVRNEVLIVYDFKEDDSIPAIKEMQKDRENLRLIHNTLGKGVINAIKAGVNAAYGTYVLTIAADDIGPLLAINDMASLMDQGCDLVNATRYAYGGKNIGGTFISGNLSSIANKLFYLLSGSSLTDPTFGVKMFKKDLFGNLNLESKPIGWAVAFEFAIKAQIAGWKLGEIPLISLNRLYGRGRSSFKLKWLLEYSRWFLFGMKHLLFKKRNKVIRKIPSNMKR